MTDKHNRPGTDQSRRDQTMVELDEAALDAVAGGDKNSTPPAPAPIIITKHVDTSSPTLN